MKLKKGDRVQVISGDDLGKTGEIMKVFPKENRVLVEGIGAYKKHLKPNVRNKEGGIVTLYRPIYASKVMILDPEKNIPTRIRLVRTKDGVSRIAVKSQKPLVTKASSK